MAKAATSGQARSYNAMSVSCIDEETLQGIDGAKFQSIIDNPDEFRAKFTAWINNGCNLQMVLVNAFTVGDVFRHRAEEGDRRLWLSSNTQNWLIKPNLKKVVPIPTKICKIGGYELTKDMDDSSIQEEAGSPGFMSEEEFFCVMYLLIFQPELAKQALGFTLKKDKYYIFHVVVGDKKVTFVVYWDDVEWGFEAANFDNHYDWRKGFLFVSFTTV